MKYLSKFTRSLGIFLIVLFSALSIFFTIIYRDISRDEVGAKKFIYYAPYLENNFYDWRMSKHLDKIPKNDKVVLAALTDETLQSIGSWPVPRTVWAEFLRKMKVYGAKVVGFDVIFPEPATACNAESPDDIFNDAILDFQSIEGNKVIMAYTVESHQDFDVFQELPEHLYNFIMDSQQSGEGGIAPRYVVKHTYPIDKLLEHEPDMGYINMLEDDDGVFRHYQLVANVDGLYLPSFGYRAYESYTGEQQKLIINSDGSASMKLNGNVLQINNQGENKVRWIGGIEKFQEVEIHHVLDASDDDAKMLENFKDKIVMIGSTATGAHDLRNSPIDSKMPGVYAHMNVVHMLMNGYFYHDFQDSIKHSLYLLMAGLIVILLMMRIGNAFIDLLGTFAVVAAAYFVDYYYYLPQGYEIKLFFCFVTYLGTYSWVTFLNFNQASQEKKQIKGAFSRYVASSIVDDMLQNPEKLKVGGERKDITCLFSDVRDFTSISEQLTANELAGALNYYMGKMTDVIFETKGTLDKYIGDAIVCFWGAPIEIGNHVDYAMEGAVKMLEILPAVNEELLRRNLPEFKIGLGLNSGECNVGNMGSDQIFAYTALGDTMNLGARLESLCKHYGAQILISEYTYERMDKTRFIARKIDNVTVKGKTKPVGVYEVLYSYHPMMLNPEALAKFNQAFDLFVQAKFSDAKALFEEVLTVVPTDKSSQRMKETCEHWIECPPAPGQDHIVTTMTTK